MVTFRFYFLADCQICASSRDVFFISLSYISSASARKTQTATAQIFTVWLNRAPLQVRWGICSLTYGNHHILGSSYTKGFSSQRNFPVSFDCCYRLDEWTMTTCSSHIKDKPSQTVSPTSLKSAFCCDKCRVLANFEAFSHLSTLDLPWPTSYRLFRALKRLCHLWLSP